MIPVSRKKKTAPRSSIMKGLTRKGSDDVLLGSQAHTLPGGVHVFFGVHISSIVRM